MPATMFAIEISLSLVVLLTDSEPILKLFLSVATIFFTFVEVLHLNAANFSNLTKLRHQILKEALVHF